MPWMAGKLFKTKGVSRDTTTKVNNRSHALEWAASQSNRELFWCKWRSKICLNCLGIIVLYDFKRCAMVLGSCRIMPCEWVWCLQLTLKWWSKSKKHWYATPPSMWIKQMRLNIYNKSIHFIFSPFLWVESFIWSWGRDVTLKQN